jgi:hypothetical protein
MTDDARMTMNSKMLRVFVASLAGLAAAVTAMGVEGVPGTAAPCQRSVAIDPQVTVSEATPTLTFVVYSGSCAAAGSVSYVVSDAGARRPGDFVLANGILSWGPGDTSSRRITATIVADRLLEAQLEDFKVTLVEPSAGVRVASASGQGRIFDDDSERHLVTVDDRVCLLGASDPASPVPLATPTPTATTCTIEPGHISYLLSPIVLNAPNATSQSLHFETSDGDLVAGLDYVAVSQTVVIPAWTIAVFVQVKLLPHAFTVGGHFNVHISGYTGGGAIVAGDGQITVLP